ncbi:MAG: divalent-cation tolerance protein CutA [bacterium]|nr:divalent-cation tolerance protein CutA [bacterium]MBK8127502.1 divalent-cation tolerance protein CutA [bacterium]
MAKGHGEILILTTIDHEEKAVRFAKGLLDKRLAACVTRLPGGHSMYRWEFAEVTDNPEIVLLIKSHHSRLSEIESYFADEHPYSEPELLVFDVAGIGDSYRAWLMKEIGL